MEKLLYSTDKINSFCNLVMAYPAIENFAMSSLGYLWLYKLADSTEGMNVKRVYTDKIIFPFKQTDAVSFSMSFDFDFMGVFKILEKNNIPLFSKDRTQDMPLIFAGGPVITTNPLPYNKIFDFMIIGDGETVLKEILDILQMQLPKRLALEKLSHVEGIYVPNISQDVKKVTEKLDNVIYTPILSDNSYFENTFIIELERGCKNCCAFCTASYLNLPIRFNIYAKIIEAINLGLKYTNKIALLGAQVSAHPDFENIIKYLYNRIQNGENIEIGISSLRADTISDSLVKMLVLSGQKTSTIAIESASERLRKLINKNLTNDQILNAVKTCRSNGLKGLKIYCMLGLPTETQEDIEEFIKLANLLKAENKGFDITFSFSTFVPKPHTPFQWAKREDTKSLESKIKYLEKSFAKIGIEAKFSSAKWDYWQTVLSRGDDSIGDFMVEVYKLGGKIGAYKTALKSLNLDISKTIFGYSYEENLPWDCIHINPDKQHLLKEYNRLLSV